MFSRPPRTPSQSMSGMYHSVQTDTGAGSASPHRLVAMLFEGFFDACSQARGHIKTGNVEQKCRAIGRAVRIVDEGLRAPLDLANGGAIAGDLRDLYAYVTMRLTHANLRSDEAAIEECQSLLRPIQSAWQGIGAQVGAA